MWPVFFLSGLLSCARYNCGALISEPLAQGREGAGCGGDDAPGASAEEWNCAALAESEEAKAGSPSAVGGDAGAPVDKGRSSPAMSLPRGAGARVQDSKKEKDGSPNGMLASSRRPLLGDGGAAGKPGRGGGKGGRARPSTFAGPFCGAAAGAPGTHHHTFHEFSNIFRAL